MELHSLSTLINLFLTLHFHLMQAQFIFMRVINILNFNINYHHQYLRVRNHLLPFIIFN